MSKKSSKTRNPFAHYNFANPRGDILIATPWKSLSHDDKKAIPYRLRVNLPLRQILFWTAAILTFLGLLLSSKASLAAGLALAITLHWLGRKTWQQSGDVVVERFVCDSEVAGGDTYSVRFTVKNNGRTRLQKLVCRLETQASQVHKVYQAFTNIKPGERRTVIHTLTADRGMGFYSIGPVQVTVSDFLGLWLFTVSADCYGALKVWPEDQSLEGFPVSKSGRSLLFGQGETNHSGPSPLFLGIRHWRLGDRRQQIEWPRSLRQGELLVKEYEQLRATDVSIFIDQSPEGHCEFGGISSIKSMRLSTLALARDFLAQRLRVQVRGGVLAIPFGSGRSHEELITDALMTTDFTGEMEFSAFVLGEVPTLPVESFVVLVFCSANIALENLLKALIAIEERRCEYALVVYDSVSYSSAVLTRAHLTAMQARVVHELWARLANDAFPKKFDRMIQRMADRTYLIPPGESLIDLRQVWKGA